MHFCSFLGMKMYFALSWSTLLTSRFSKCVLPNLYKWLRMRMSNLIIHSTSHFCYTFQKTPMALSSSPFSSSFMFSSPPPPPIFFGSSRPQKAKETGEQLQPQDQSHERHHYYHEPVMSLVVNLALKSSTMGIKAMRILEINKNQ